MKKKIIVLLLFLKLPIFLFGVDANVTNFANLEIAIKDANDGTVDNIIFSNNITVGPQNLRPLNVNDDFSAAGKSYTIDGVNGRELDPAGDYRGFFVAGSGTPTGTITIKNITFKSCGAKGGTGGHVRAYSGKGGGGAGIGGGLFVGKGNHVILENAVFTTCSATGGEGGGFGVLNPSLGGGGGGGLGGNAGQGLGGAQQSGAGGGGGFIGNGGNGVNVGDSGGGGGAGSGGDGVSSVGTTGGNGGLNLEGLGTPGAGGIPPPPDDGGPGETGTGGGGGGSKGTGGTGGYGSGGGGGGGESGLAGYGGLGGFAGGGGGGAGQSSNGGNGGFGGGGGGGGGPGGSLGDGGRGGFGGGGGGGARNATTGGAQGTSVFGGGEGGYWTGAVGVKAGLGGGGAAMGGAIFIEDGGFLTIETNISFSGSSLTAGAAGTEPDPQGSAGQQPGSTHGIDIFMMSGADLTFNISNDVDLTEIIESDQGAGLGSGGGLTKKGSATLSLNGDNTYTGTTNVQAGSFVLNGSIITDVVVDGGSFSGEATVTGNFTNNSGAVVAPGNSTGVININGNYIQNSGGSLEIEVNSVIDRDLLAITGTAHLDGTLDVIALAGNYIEGTTITFLTADGGVFGGFSHENLPVTGDGESIFHVYYLSNAVQLLVINNIFFEGQYIEPGNPTLTVDYIEKLLPITPRSDLAYVVSILGMLSDEELNIALNELHPALYGVLEWINLNNNNQVSNIFAERVNELCCSVRDCHSNMPNAKQRDIWVQPFGNFSKHHRLSQLRGYQSTNVGFVAGYDKCYNNFYLGGGLGYSKTNLRWRDKKGEGNAHNVFGGFYGNYFHPWVIVDLSVLGGSNWYNLERNINYSGYIPDTTVDRIATSFHRGKNLTTHFGVRGDFKKRQVSLQPFGKFDYFYLYQSRYHEHGATSLNLDVRKNNSHMIKTEVGALISNTMILGHGCISPYLSMSYVSKVPLSNGKYRSSFQDQTVAFEVDATNRAMHQAATNIGIKATGSNGFSFSIDARAEFNGKMADFFGNMRLDYCY